MVPRRALAGAWVLAACAVAWHMGTRRGVVLEELPPGARLLADALRDVATTAKSEPLTRAAHEHSGKGGGAGARGDGVPDSASVHAMKFTGLERLALQMRKLTPLASMPRRDDVISASSLPAAGSHAWKIAETKAALRVSSLQLQLDKQKRRLDVENAEHAALLHGPVGEQLQARQAMAGRAKREVAAAKDMEAKARKLSDEVVSDLHVAKGHYDIKQWYRSQSAFKSSKESTDAVNKAKKLWAKAMVDRQALRKVVGPHAFVWAGCVGWTMVGWRPARVEMREGRARCLRSVRERWSFAAAGDVFAAADGWGQQVQGGGRQDGAGASADRHYGAGHGEHAIQAAESDSAPRCSPPGGARSIC